MQLDVLNRTYKEGFFTKIKSKRLGKGLNKEIIKKISKERKEPAFMLDFRLRAFEAWGDMSMPSWGSVCLKPIDFQEICYHSEPEKTQSSNNEIVSTFEKLGIPLRKGNEGLAIDAVFDSKSVWIAGKEKIKNLGIIFCSIREACVKYPEIIKKYLASVVPVNDNFFAALNSAVFSDGTFIFVPKGIKCPIELVTYFRINDMESGQFERTLIIADEGSYVSYMEGCSAPIHKKHQLHAAVVELVALKDAEIKYSTVQNWYSGDENGKGGVYNLVTKRGLCEGEKSKISWAQVEVGSAVTWKYPSCILKGDDSEAKFYSISVTSKHMQAETGTKMLHVGKNSKSNVIAKSITAGNSKSTYRSLVSIAQSAKGSKSYAECDSMLFGENATTQALPELSLADPQSDIRHEAFVSKMDEAQVLYLESRGFSKERAIQLIVTSFCEEVIKQLPLEFAVEAKNLLSLNLG